ncbi:hypothetical protein A4G16_02195 [Mannheimia granulomatis]|uniref:Uncharacterized protein n=1 Tax=Mannheimia granulomatis TaxID=85402 RepID=A0A6G8JGJ8_9PAST|nr:hypothetical protein [Mannheimia granulomatis]QIM66267.1 hypothetical protein A4G16_02195 [Mannheimia granulomatis]
MYYINKAISYRVDFINSVSKNWHCISKVSLDYVNKECMFEISSYDNEEDFKNNNNSFVTFLTLNAIPNFSVDPILFIWRCLISSETSPFYKADLQKDYSIEQFKNKEEITNESIPE